MGNNVSTVAEMQCQHFESQHAHPALYQYDILSMIFDVFDLEDKKDRATCACSALICWAWTEPASRALWSRTKWKLPELCTVLECMAPTRSSSPKHGLLGKMRHILQQDKRARLRHSNMQREVIRRYGAKIRHVCIAQFGRPSPWEGQLLQRVLSMNDGRTFLPALLSLSWVECPITSGLLVGLLPHSLQGLELIVTSETSTRQVYQLFNGLSHPTFTVRNLRICAWKPEVRCVIVNCLPKFTSIRNLSLSGNIEIGLEDARMILSGLALSSIEAKIRDFTTFNKTIEGGDLNEFHLEGSCADLTAFVSHLYVPNLRTADLRFNIIDGNIDQNTHHRLSQMLLKFSPTLRSLQLEYRTSLSCTRDARQIFFVPDVLEPLFGRLELVNFTLWSDLQITLTDEHILRLAQGWPMLRSLSLTHPYRRGTIPTTAALVHLAQHCPNLQFLRIQLCPCHLPQPERASFELHALRHPLRTLLQTHKTCDSSEQCRSEYYWTIWRKSDFLESLFPYLETFEKPTGPPRVQRWLHL